VRFSLAERERLSSSKMTPVRGGNSKSWSWVHAFFTILGENWRSGSSHLSRCFTQGTVQESSSAVPARSSSCPSAVRASGIRTMPRRRTSVPTEGSLNQRKDAH